NQGRVWLGGDLSVRPQGWGGLGRRMQRAFAEAWREGMHRVVLFGSDCPGLAPRHLLAACQALAGRDVVLGPARDGGYYLVGLGRPVTGLFRGMPWGQPSVLARTRQRICDQGLTLALLEELADIDRPADLVHLPAGWR
ncbi:MAG: TIGR04282 family arsenosugar biosynthesis glycosyltransferase, partial [Thermodesulfobacteriota bacterium]